MVYHQLSRGLRKHRAKLINGRAMAAGILAEVRSEVRYMKEKSGIVPGLATILVGQRPESTRYVAIKQAVARSAGFTSMLSEFPHTVQEDEILHAINKYNSDPHCHGIFIQNPLPSHLSGHVLNAAIMIEKDVEGFHPFNAGRLSSWKDTILSPCTPRGVMEMLHRLGVDLVGKHACVIGCSDVVGLPLALMLMASRATTTVITADTLDPQNIVKTADVVIAAAGCPGLVTKDWIKHGAAVVDVGINFVKSTEQLKGFKMVGDVSHNVREKASIVSPVPGGVGPMTVAMLMRNCMDAAILQGMRLHSKPFQEMIAKQVSSISSGAHRITTERSSIDTPSCSVRGKPNSTISDDEFVTSIYKEKEHNAYNVMALLDMWQCFERDILSEDRSSLLSLWRREARSSEMMGLGSKSPKQDTDMSSSSCVVDEGDFKEEVGIQWWNDPPWGQSIPESGPSTSENAS